MKNNIVSERVNLFEPNVYITMVVNIEGSIDEREIICAVNNAYTQNETTMSKIVLDNGQAYYQKVNTSGCRVYVDNRFWKDIIKDNEKSPFQIEKGELIRTYINMRNNECTLVIIAHHLVGDGKSILIFIEDIMNNLADKKVNYKPIRIIDRDFLSKKVNFSFGLKLYIRYMNRKWKKKGTVFSWRDYYHVHEQYWKKYSSDIKTKSYTKEELQIMKKDAEEIGVTLNSFLITQVLRENSECINIGIPISIREENGSMSNQTSGISIVHQYDSNKTFEENAKEIHQKIYKKINNNFSKYFVIAFTAELMPSLIDSVVLCTNGCYANAFSEKMAKSMVYMGKRKIDLGVTNLTKIDIHSDYDKYKIKNILFIPPKVSYTNRVIGISSFKDTLTISYHSMITKEK